MKFNQNDKHSIKLVLTVVTLSLIVCATVWNFKAVWGLLGLLWNVCVPFIAGLCLAFIVNMPMSLLERRIYRRIPKAGLRRAVALVSAYVLVIAVIFFIFMSVLPQLIASLRTLVNNVPSFLQNLHDYAIKINAPEAVITFIENSQETLKPNVLWDYIVKFFSNEENTEFVNQLLNNVVSVLSIVLSSFISVFLTTVFSIYILASKEDLGKQAKELLYSFFSEKFADGVMYVFYTAYDNFYNFFTGQFLEAIALGTMCFVGMSLLNLPYAIVISVLIGFCALIPMVGPIIGALVGCLLLLIESPLSAVGFAVFIVCLQQFDGNLVYPRIVGKSVGLPSMWVLFAITVGGSLFGVLGMLIFVPIISTAYDLLTDFKTRRLVSRKIQIEEK